MGKVIKSESIRDGEKVPSTWFTGRRLTMQGLKPSDYFLYAQMKTFFNFDMRQLFVLGLRYLYSSAYDEVQREKIRAVANMVCQDDLDIEKDRPTYVAFQKLMDGK